jgi:hypothetical protein
MTPLTPSDFHDRLDSAMPAPAADGPLQPAVEADIAAGRSRLRRRRGATLLGAVATLAVVAGGIGLANGLGGAATDIGPATLPSGNAGLLDACRAGESETSPAAIEAIYGSGTPTVKSVARIEKRVVLTLESADGNAWGGCTLNQAPDTEFDSSLEAYDARGRTRSSGYASGWTCEAEDVCSGFSVWMTDRRPGVVAAVEFLTADGETTTVETTDGYFAFAHDGELAEPVSERRMTGGFTALKRITFLDAAGTPIAAEAQDGSGAGPDGERVGDLPSITEFPSLRGEQSL